MVKNLGLDSRRNEWRLARWFLAFATAPDLKRLRRFKEEAEFVASTKAGIALVSTKGGILFKPNIPDQDLSYVKTEVWKAINWALDEKARVRGMSTAPLTGIPAEAKGKSIVVPNIVPPKNMSGTGSVWIQRS